MGWMAAAVNAWAASWMSACGAQGGLDGLLQNAWAASCLLVVPRVGWMGCCKMRGQPAVCLWCLGGLDGCCDVWAAS